MSRADSSAVIEAEKKQQVSAAKALISSIKAASSREEIALLIGACRSLIEQCPESLKGKLESDLRVTADTVETKIQREVIRKQEEAHDAQQGEAKAPIAPDPVKLVDKSPEDLEKLAKENKKLNVLSAAILAAQETGKTNLKDTAFGNALIAIEEQEKKEAHRETSKSRVDLLKNLGETLSSGGEIPEAMFEQAKDLKIDLKLDKDGNPSEKTLKAINAIQKLNPEAIETERAKRAAPTEDIFDSMGKTETLGLNNLFGDEDTFGDNTPAARATPTLLNKLVKNSTRPARIDPEVSTELTNLSPTKEPTATPGEKVKTFENEDTKVVLTQRKNANDARFRDIEVNVEKGPALVAICMQDENGKKDKDSKFAIEFDKDGNAIKTIPDLSLVETDKESNLAFIEVDGKRMVLPMSAERVERLRAEVKVFGPEPERAPEPQAAAGTTRAPVEHTPAEDPLLSTIRSKKPHEKTPAEIELEYAAMSKDHMKLLTEEKLAGLHDRAKSDELGAKMAEYEAVHSDKSLIPQEQIDKNLKSMEEALKIGQIQYQAEVKEELSKAFKNQAEAVASHDSPSLSHSEGQERLAKEKLAHAGLTPDSIKLAEKEALGSALSKSMETGLQKEVDHTDPIIEAKEQKFLKTKMSSTGMTREEVKEKELDSTVQAATSLSSKLLQQKEGAAPEDQRKIDEQIGKIEKITSPRVASLSAPSKAEKIVTEVQAHSSRTPAASSVKPRKPGHERSRAEAGTGTGIA